MPAPFLGVWELVINVANFQSGRFGGLSSSMSADDRLLPFWCVVELVINFQLFRYLFPGGGPLQPTNGVLGPIMQWIIMHRWDVVFKGKTGRPPLAERFGPLRRASATHHRRVLSAQ